MCLRNAMRVKTSAAMHSTKRANNTRMAILLKDNKVEDGRAIRMIVRRPGFVCEPGSIV
jgi:hypothetical protein